MAKFVHRPTVVEAVQFNVDANLDHPGIFWQMAGQYFYVETIHGDQIPIVHGDYIVKESDDVHYYSIKPSIFERNYESVKE